MVELITSYTMSQVPYITNDALDAYAEDVLRDAMPEVLLTPCPIDAESFLEFYLGLDVIYKRLSYDSQILGMTAFDAGYVQIIDEISGKAEPMPVKAGTVIIEPSLTLKWNTHRRRFTYMHEASHWILHRRAYLPNNPFGKIGKYENQYLAAKEGRVDYSRSQKIRTDSEHMERQADFLASAILMPRRTLRMAYRDFFKYYDEKPRKVVRGTDYLDDYYAVQMTEYISELFSVSKRAALIRLEKLGAITDKPKTR